MTRKLRLDILFYISHEGKTFLGGKNKSKLKFLNL